MFTLFRIALTIIAPGPMIQIYPAVGPIRGAIPPPDVKAGIPIKPRNNHSRYTFRLSFGESVSAIIMKIIVCNVIGTGGSGIRIYALTIKRDTKSGTVR